MSSIFGHDLAAVYRDRAYTLRPRVSWLAIGAAFAVGVGATAAVMKVPVNSDEPATVTASRSVSKPAASSAPTDTGKSVAAKPSVRVIAPDVIPPPPNVTAAATREAARPQPRAAADSAVTDPNTGAAPRDQIAESTPPQIVPMPPPKPAEPRLATGPAPTPETPSALPGTSPSPPANAGTAAVPPPASSTAALEPPAQEPAAKPTRKETKAARREARRLEREERRRLAQERARALQQRDEAADFSVADGYRTRDGRRYTIYRRYDDDRSRAMAYGDDYYRSGRRGFFGLFDFD
jgi:hypothetical protein